ncbi:MAG TPA: Mu-like prophage major head subunit gpT family protein [Acidovorax sp.]|jgi:phage major head subunit gpT-like protein|nr:Mu-like prophage major head subunit gpT family protein [Acidovorax sp.]
MHINNTNLKALFVAFNAAFKEGLGQAQSQYTQIATTVPSTTGAEEYAWLGQLPGLREWLGDRVIHAIGNHGYTIKNKPFELTVGVPRTAIEDDQYGVYTPLMTEMGRAVDAHPDQLVFKLLKDGRTALCYDEQPFFSTQHKVLNEKGKEVNVSNLSDDGGSGASWYLLDTRRALKPLIYQSRKEPNFVALVNETDENVFNRAQYVYGVDARRNAGFGFWQLAHASNKALTAANLKAAITAMETQTGDHGRPLGISPNLLVVPKVLRFDAKKLLENELVPNEAGTATESNAVKGATDLLVGDWL